MREKVEAIISEQPIPEGLTIEKRKIKKSGKWQEVMYVIKSEQLGIIIDNTLDGTIRVPELRFTIVGDFENQNFEQGMCDVIKENLESRSVVTSTSYEAWGVTTTKKEIYHDGEYNANGEHTTWSYWDMWSKLRYYTDLEAMKKMPYDEYLKSRYWEILSKECKQLAGYKCAQCGSGERLEAHHCSYANKGNPTKEIVDLKCLCHSCHSRYHNK